MISDRRSFLRVGSLLVCGSFLRPRSLLALGEKTPGVLSFDATELHLLDFVSSYSSIVRLTGASVLGHFKPDSGCGMRVIAQVTDFGKLAEATLRAPFKNFYAKATPFRSWRRGAATSSRTCRLAISRLGSQR